jgi:hypothetical protein
MSANEKFKPVTVTGHLSAVFMKLAAGIGNEGEIALLGLPMQTRDKVMFAQGILCFVQLQIKMAAMVDGQLTEAHPLQREMQKLISDLEAMCKQVGIKALVFHSVMPDDANSKAKAH